MRPPRKVPGTAEARATLSGTSHGGERLHPGRPPGIALTLEEAARACGVRQQTLEFWVERSLFPNAILDAERETIRVPVADLESAGLRPRRHLYQRVATARILFGILFGIDAALKWLPSFATGFLGQISGAAQGQPAWLRPWFHFWVRVFSVDPGLFAYITAVVETLVSVALILGVARAVTYFTAAVYSLAIWAIPEGFGGPYTHGVTDIGTGIIYSAVFLALYQLDTLADESPWSLDPLIERHLPWWRKLSEPWFRVKGGGAGWEPARRL